jgi:hypothetical protein
MILYVLAALVYVLIGIALVAAICAHDKKMEEAKTTYFAMFLWPLVIVAGLICVCHLGLQAFWRWCARLRK